MKDIIKQKHELEEKIAKMIEDFRLSICDQTDYGVDFEFNLVNDKLEILIK